MKNKIEVGDLVGHQDATFMRGIVIKLEHQRDFRYTGGRWYARVLWVKGGPSTPKGTRTRCPVLVTLAKGSNK